MFSDILSDDTSSAMLLGKNNDILIRTDPVRWKKKIELIKGYLKYEFVSIIVIDVLFKNKIFRTLYSISYLIQFTLFLFSNV